MTTTQTLLPITIMYETTAGETLALRGSLMVPDEWVGEMPEGVIKRVFSGDPRKLRGDERWSIEEPNP